jgi:PAS domain S-box-containing protein
MSESRREPNCVRAGIRLQSAVVLALVLLLLTSIGISSAIWYWNGQRMIRDSAQAVQSEIALRIKDHLSRFLAVPQEIIAANAAALRLLDPSVFGPRSIEALLRTQILLFDTVSSVYVGSAEGGIIDAGRESAGGPLYVIETEGFRSGVFKKYRIDENGVRQELIQSIESFDARTRPWFTAAVEAQGPAWSDIYALFSGQDMAVAASLPLFDEEGRLLYVLSSDIFLSQVDHFLRSLEYSKSGLGFIIDRAGLMIASSTEEIHLRMDEATQNVLRVPATESPSPFIRQAGQFLQQTFGNLSALPGTYQGQSAIKGDRLLIQVQPIRNEHGIDWLAVIAIPESDFMAPLLATTRTALLLLAITLAVSIGAGALFVRRGIRPVQELTAAARALGKGGRVFTRTPRRSFIRETRDLWRSFGEMSERIDSTLGDLRSEIEHRKQAERTLLESEERLRTYIERSPLAIVVLNAVGRFVDANLAACRVSGYSREELLGLHAHDLFESSMSSAGESLTRQLKESGSASGELSARTRYGDSVWLQIDAVALGADRLVAFCTDLTERKLTEESLRHQQKMESLGTMSSGVAHEINNPLMGMMNYAELIETRISDPDVKGFAKSIVREGERIAHILRNLRSFSQEEAAVRHPFNIRHVIADALHLVHNPLMHSHVMVHEHLDQDVPEVVCSRQQIQQVIVNLLMNARDALDAKYPEYHPEKTVDVIVRTVQCTGRLWVRTSIQDHGIGMSKEKATRAFDPFFTTRSRDERTGLGLTVSFGIVREHGGNITIESEEGEGTTVHIDLPADTQT